MSKKRAKKQKSGAVPVISPERYMREKARTLPIGDCYITPGWEDSGICQIIVTRVRPSGNMVAGIFLVDTFCLGVKDAFYRVNMTPEDFQDLLERFDTCSAGLERISYEEAHNIIYGAMAYAEDIGIAPAKGMAVTGYVLEEDTDDVPLIEYEFGKDGKPMLIVGEDRREMSYIDVLRKKLGDDGFDYVVPKGLIDRGYLKTAMEKMGKMLEESGRLPKEEYSYVHPAYPASLSVKNQWLVSELMDPANKVALPDDVIDRILSLPADEAAGDISRIVMFEIGRTYKEIEDDTIESSENSPLMHAVLLLTQLRSREGLDAMLEILRQSDSFADYHFGDLAPEILHPALYATGLNDVDRIEEYLNTPGFTWYMRNDASRALAMIAIRHPERRDEIIGVFRRNLDAMVERLPRHEACDGAYAGSLMSVLLDLGAKELLPEIERVFATECVDRHVAGDFKEVKKKLNEPRPDVFIENYDFPDIHKQYDEIRKFYD